MEKQTVAALVQSVVPYHVARWQALAGRGQYDVHLIENTNIDGFSPLTVQGLRLAGLTRFTLFPNRQSECISRSALFREVHSYLSSFSPNLVCVSGWASWQSLIALNWASRRNTPIMLVSESNQADFSRNFVRETTKKVTLSLCSAALVGGTSHRDYLVSLGMPPDAVFQGYDAVDNEHFARKADDARRKPELRGQLRLPRRYFLACSRFTPKKNLCRLVEAFAQYQRTTPDPWNLVVVGDGALKGQLEISIREHGLERQVLLAGPKTYEELPAYYGLASAFILPSTTEQWGLVVNEAMAAGLPVLVSSRCGCAGELVSVGQNGWTFDPFSTVNMAAVMQAMTQISEEMRKSLCEESKRIVAQWGTNAFASGMTSALIRAQTSAPPTGGRLSRMLCLALLLRPRG